MVRTVTEDLDATQNLVHLHLLEGSMNHKNITPETTDALEKKNRPPRVRTVYVRGSKLFIFRGRVACRYLASRRSRCSPFNLCTWRCSGTYTRSSHAPLPEVAISCVMRLHIFSYPLYTSAPDLCLAFIYDSAAVNLKCVKDVLSVRWT